MQESKKRKAETVTVACPIVYGSIAFYLGKKADQLATHKWTLFVRGPNDEDLSVFVQKVAFTLHPSFAEPVREITKPPFEVSETGWGEFEAGIRIFFKDPEEHPVDLFQHIRLYPMGTQQQLNPKKPVMAESYDENVFTDPSPRFFSLLMAYCPSNPATAARDEAAGSSSSENGNDSPRAHSNGPAQRALKLLQSSSSSSTAAVTAPLSFSEHYTMFDDSVDLETLTAIHEHVRREIEVAKNKLVYLECTAADSVHRTTSLL